MTLTEYIEATTRTMPKDRSREQNISMLALGLAGEISETSVALRDGTLHTIAKEIGDVMWYVAGLTNLFSIDLNFNLEAEVESSKNILAKLYDIYGADHIEEGAAHLLLEDAGAIAELVKKHLYHGKEMDMPRLDELLGGIIVGCITLVELKAMDFTRILSQNIEKLKKRYPEGFTVQASLNRAE